MSGEHQGVRWHARDGVFELELGREPCNEIGRELLIALERFLDEVEASDARAVILHSTQRAGFSAGADLRGLYAEIAERAPVDFLPELSAFLDRIHAVMNRLDALRQTTIAAIHGVCFGGGFELALACDLWIADRTARFGFPELRLGLVPGFGGVPRLRRECANALVRDLVLTGRSLGAKRAYELGMVSQLVTAGEALAVARATARQAALFDPAVNGRAKAFIKPIPLAELEAEKQLFLSLAAEPRLKAALRDFVCRRDPQPYLPRAAAPEGGR